MLNSPTLSLNYNPPDPLLRCNFIPHLEETHLIMFKSILPSSKRTPSFDLVVPDDKGGKENRPQHPLAKELTAKDAFKVPAVPPQKKFGPAPATMKVKEKETGGLVGAGAMNRAFEKMLVRTFSLVAPVRSHITHRILM